MPKRVRLTRRKTIPMTEDAYRRLRTFAADADLSEGEALSVVFENLATITDETRLQRKVQQFHAQLGAQKR